MKRRRSEQELQKALLQHLAWRGVRGIFAFHYPAGGWRSPIEAAIFKSLGVVAGVPDLIIIYDGHCFALELKAADGRLTPIQVDTQARMRAAGATVGTAVEIDAALELLERWGLLRPDVSVMINRGRPPNRRACTTFRPLGLALDLIAEESAGGRD